MQTDNSRFAVFERMWKGGMRSKKAIMLAAGISRSTLYHYIQIVERGERLVKKKRECYPRKFTTSIRRELAQLLVQHPHHTSVQLARELRDRHKQEYSACQVRRVLRNMGYRYHLPKRTKLNPKNKMVRLSWAKNHIGTDWEGVWSYDESYFNIGSSRGEAWYKVEMYERVAPRKLTTKQEKASVCVAVAVSHNAKSKLCFLPHAWNPEQLHEIFRDELLPSIQWDPSTRRCKSFIIDNDGRHHNKLLKGFLEEQQMLRMGFLPENSPDLNPIENVFSCMKRYVMKKAPSTEQELRQAVIEAWDAIDTNYLRTLFRSMPKRIQQVIDKKGSRINY